MSPQLLIQLVSEQTMPNLLPILAADPAKVLLLHSDRTRTQAGWIRAAAGLAGVETDFEDCCLDNASDLHELASRVAKAGEVALSEGLMPLVNITGGTKLMSIGAYAAAHGRKIGSFYVDSENRLIHDGRTAALPAPFDEPSRVLDRAAKRLTVPIIAAANGTMVSGGRDPEPWLPAARLIQNSRRVESDCQRLVRSLDEGKRWVDDYIRILDTDLDQLPEPLVEPLALAGAIALREGSWRLSCGQRDRLEGWARGDPISRIEDFYAVVGSIQETLAFLSGGWWELAVWDAARKSGRFHDIRWSCVKDVVGTDAFMEEDLLAVDGMRLAVFSCKRSGDHKRLLRAFEELESSARHLGGSQTSRFLCLAMPISNSQLNAVRTRAEQSATTLIGPVDRLSPSAFRNRS